MSGLRYFLYNNIPGSHPTWTLAVLATGQKDADQYVRAWNGGGKRAGVVDEGSVKADCGGVTVGRAVQIGKSIAMSKAPTGAIVSLYYDSPRLIQEGDCLRTPAGRCYLLVGVRRQTKGRHVGRWHIKGLVIDAPPAGANVYPIVWYPRKKKGR